MATGPKTVDHCASLVGLTRARATVKVVGKPRNLRPRLTIFRQPDAQGGILAMVCA